MPTIKVLLADDHEIFRNGVRTLIDNEPDMQVIGEAANGEEVLALVEKLEPDVLIMDIRMPKLNGIDSSKLLLSKNPHFRILIFSLYDNVEYVIQALNLGAKGYILKDTSNKIFLDAIRAVNKDQFYYIGDVSHTVINYFKTSGQTEPEVKNTAQVAEHLSKKELEIIKLIKIGKNSKDIADELGNSVRTIDAHRYNIIKKFNSRSMEEVIGLMEKFL